MRVNDDVRCNNDLFGDHRGETLYASSLNSVFPGSTYEITPSGRSELFECTYEDRSDPHGPLWMRLGGMMTQVFTGKRSDVALHGWVEFLGFGRAKFTDGTMVAFDPDVELSKGAPVKERAGVASVLPRNLQASIYMQGEALGELRVNERAMDATCLRCGHLITDDQGSRDVLEHFWAHQVFEHHVPPDVIGVIGLEQIGSAGIRLQVQIVVEPNPQS